MLGNLIESRPQKKRSPGTTFFSVGLHAALALGAVYATTNAGIREDAPEKIEKVRFVEMKKEPPPPVVKEPEPPKPKEPPKTPPKKAAPKVIPKAPAVAPTPAAPPKGFQTLQAPVTVPVKIPDIDLSAKVTNEADFSGKGVKGGTGSGEAGGTGTVDTAPTNNPYHEFQVEVAVSPISNTIRPQYPEMLRTSGVEGQVQAEFVVNEQGRIEAGTFKVLKSDNEAFTRAVKNAIGSMRFKPARIGNTPVKQIVQQAFVFKLDR